MSERRDLSWPKVELIDRSNLQYTAYHNIHSTTSLLTVCELYSNLGQLKFSSVAHHICDWAAGGRDSTGIKKDLKMDTWGIYRGGKDEGSPIYHYDVYKCSHNGSFAVVHNRESIQACSILKIIIFFMPYAEYENKANICHLLHTSYLVKQYSIHFHFLF